LLSLFESTDSAPPPRRDQVESLTPWAAAFRYDEPGQQAVDREAAPELLNDVVKWADEQLDNEP